MRRLLDQIREIMAQRRSIRLAEHRNALRLKRAAVRAAINAELRLEDARSMREQLDNAIAVKRVAVARDAALAAMQRRAAFESHATALGLTPPPHKRGQAGPNAPDVGAEKPQVGADDFANRVVAGVEQLLPDDSHAAQLVRDEARVAIRAADARPVQSLQTDHMDEQALRATQLVASLARDAGLSQARMDELVNSVAGGNAAEAAQLRAALRSVMPDGGGSADMAGTGTGTESGTETETERRGPNTSTA